MGSGQLRILGRLMIGALAFGSRGSGVSPGHYVLSLAKTLYSYSASLHSDV